MQPQGKPPAEEYVEMTFPRAGIDLSRACDQQQPRALPSGEYGRTCRDGVNVRSFESTTGHGRGGSRTGIERWIDQAIVDPWIVQDINVVTTTSATAQS